MSAAVPSPPTLTILSNGHGEDVIGAQLALELRRLRPDLRVQGFPTVSDGGPYRSHDVPVVGPARPLPSGGFTLHGWDYLARDLRGGLIATTLRQMAALARLRSEVLLVVGDLWALVLSGFARRTLRFQLQPLVSAWLSEGADGPPNRYFMERISYPERALMRHLAHRVYVRDARTERDLRARGLAHVVALGNPMVDAVRGRPIAELARRRPLVALLPGTRAHTGPALRIMLAALALEPSLHAVVAWAGPSFPELPGWRTLPRRAPPDGWVATLERGAQRVEVFEGRFGDVLAGADAVLGTAGTANEQAAALGLPVVSFPLPPHYTEAYVRNQKRLLGDALVVSAPAPERLAADLRAALHDGARRRAAQRAGPERMGGAGGTRAVARDLLERAVAAGALPPAPAAGPGGPEHTQPFD